MHTEVLWNGNIKLLKIEKGVDSIVRIDDEEFNIDNLVVALRRIKNEYGENMALAMAYGLIGVLEGLKLSVLLSMSEVF